MESIFDISIKSSIPTSIRYFARGKKDIGAKEVAKIVGAKQDQDAKEAEEDTPDGHDQRAFEELLPKMEASVNWDLFYKSIESPPLPEQRSKYEIERHNEILKVYTKNTTKRMIQEDAFLNQIIDEQYAAIAALPKNLRDLALEFDVILPPPHPRIGVPREFPTLPEIRTDFVKPSEEEELEAAMLDEAARNNIPIETIREHVAKEAALAAEEKKVANAELSAVEADKKSKVKKEKSKEPLKTKL